jgi:drug/metabolite transporter (DMT)-like permease
VASRRVGSTRAPGVIVPTTALLIVAIFLASRASLPAEPIAFLGAMLSGLLGSLLYFAVYAALRAGPISLVIPIIFAYGGLTVLLSMLLLNEQPSALNLLAALVATCGIVLSGVVLGGTSRVRLVGRGVAAALMAVVLAASISILATVVVRQTGWVPFAVVARVTNAISVVAVLLVLAERRRRRELERGSPDAVDATSVPLRQAGWRIILLLFVLAALDVATVSLWLAGLQVGPTWLVALTGSFAPLVGILGGLTLFHERPRRLQWAGVAMVLGSGVLLAVG